MSKFTRIKDELGFWTAVQLYYTEMKRKKFRDIKMQGLKHPFSLRPNPYDYATFEEVLLRKTYDLKFPGTPQSIIDGGGNIGLTAIFFANRFPSATIVSIEPDTDNFKLLEANCIPYEKIFPVKAGVWSHSCHLKVVDTGQGNNAFTVEEVRASTPDTIEAWSIGDIMKKQQWSTIDIVKLDIEGSEKQVFQSNYESWLPKTKVLFVELHDRMVHGCSKALFTAISKYDFTCEIAGENLLLVNKAL